MAEKSKGLVGNPASCRELALLCADGDSPEDVSGFVALFSFEPGFSSGKDMTYTRLIYPEHKAIIIFVRLSGFIPNKQEKNIDPN